MAELTGRHPDLLRRGEVGLIVVDVQEGFRRVIDRFDEVVRHCGLLVEGFGLLGAPVLVSEQYPKGLGATVPELESRLPDGTPRIAKTRFSCIGVDEFDATVAATGLRRWVVCGIEAHVCVHQTVHDLLAHGHEVSVATDAIGARVEPNRQLGLGRCREAGARATGAEMALFEMLEGAGTDAFKAISRMVK